MKSIIVAALLLSSASAAVMTTHRNYAEEFAAFKAKHGKMYSDNNEEAKRFGYFVSNMKKAAELQTKNPLATYGPNSFSDLSDEEFRKYINNDVGRKWQKQHARLLQNAPCAGQAKKLNSAKKCSKVDWREKGAVTPVQNMGQCHGASFAFATVGNIESQWVVAGHNLTALSAQEALSCDGSALGCDGAQGYAFEYFLQQRAGRVVTARSLPYKNGAYSDTLDCPYKELDKYINGAVITSFAALPADEAAMGDWMCENGAIAAGVDAYEWRSYTGGIITNCQAANLNLAVLIVGFDDTHNPPYWIIKNAWGTGWGEKGYLRLKKGANECFIAMVPMTAVASKGPAPPPGPIPSVVRMYCADSNCSVGCYNMTYPLSDCQLDVINGGSTRDECNATSVTLLKYSESPLCNGPHTAVVSPTNKCRKLDDSSDYMMQFCLGKQ